MKHQIVKEVVQIEDREFQLVNYSLPGLSFDKGKMRLPGTGHMRFIFSDSPTFEEVCSYLKSLNEIVLVKMYRHTPFKTELFFEGNLKFTNSYLEKDTCFSHFVHV